MDVYVERYRAASTQLCLAHQQGALSDEEYAAQLRELRALLEPASEYAIKLSAAEGYEDRKQLITQLYETLVPAEEREKALTLEFVLEAILPVRKDGGERTRIIANPGEELPTGTEARFGVTVNHTSYVYVFQRNAKGEVNVLFPHEGIRTRNPLRAGTQQFIPPQRYFELDDQDIGTEHLYIAASPEPLSFLDAAARRAASGEVTRMEQDPTLTQLATLATGRAGSDCRSRAFVLPDGTKPICTRTRGFVLADRTVDGDDPSMVVRVDAGDDIILKDFPFEHVTLEDWEAPEGPRSRGVGMLGEW